MVDRRVFYIKAGHLEEAVKIVVAEVKRVGPPNARFYTSRTGRFDTLAIEQEFESLAAHEKFWNAWNASPEAKAVLAKWWPLIETGGTAELWDLVK